MGGSQRHGYELHNALKKKMTVSPFFNVSGFYKFQTSSLGETVSNTIKSIENINKYAVEFNHGPLEDSKTGIVILFLNWNRYALEREVLFSDCRNRRRKLSTLLRRCSGMEHRARSRCAFVLP